MRFVDSAVALVVSLLAAPVIAAPFADISASNIAATVTFLADDLLEGRQIGHRGHEIAARYVAAQFAQMGLQPAGTMGYFQRLQLQERSFASTSETLTLTRPDGSTSWLNGSALSVSPGISVGPEVIEAPLVFVGYGIISKELAINDYTGLDVRGKIVVMLTGAPGDIDSEIAAHLGRTKGSAANAMGAIGIINVRTLAQIERAPWAKTAAAARGPRRNWIGPDGTPDAEVSAVKFNAAIDDAAAERLFAGAARSLAAVRAEAVNSHPSGFGLIGTARLERNTALSVISSPNLIAVLPGSDPQFMDQMVLLTAHLDHLGVRSGDNGDLIYNGAMDNASGVAVLLEVARSFAQARKAPRRSLMFMVTTGEEGGLLGSNYFTHFPTVALRRIVSEVNIDMPILTCDFGDVIAYGAARSTMGASVKAAAQSMKIGLSPDPQPVEALFTRSDHYPFVRAGVPSVFLKTGWHDVNGGLGCRAADIAFRRDHYHEVSDDLSLPLDWNVAAKFARLNAEISRTIANNREAPIWLAGDYFGAAFERSGPKAGASITHRKF